MPYNRSSAGHGPTSNNNHTIDAGWGLDPRVRSLPTYTNVSGQGNAYGFKGVVSSAFIGLASMKKTMQRHWPLSTKQMSRTHLMPVKPPLTTSPPAYSNLVFVLLCGLWYSTSALSSNTGKAILNQFRYPVTLTFVQFGFVAFYCLLFMTPFIQFTKFRAPSKAIIQSTLPMGMFQVGGHMFSSIAMSRIPVSTVHTIKALSPLFTVAAYALLFGVSYSSKTYVSLLPLTVGVMLACSSDMSASNAVGLLCAFGSALVFVSSNIFFKKIMPSNSGGVATGPSHKLDKLNLLLYSSGMAFFLMIPLWLYHDLPVFMSSINTPGHITHPKEGHTAPHSVIYYFFMNGTVHFAQNIIAFVILSSTSPVTYSIASLLKRVAVICIAIVWFNQTVHPLQAFGIGMTFTGLYMYNNAKSDVEQGEKKMRRVEAARDLMLPTIKSESRLLIESDFPPEFAVAEATGLDGSGSAYGRPRSASVVGASHHFYHTSHHQHIHPPHNPPTKMTPPLLNTNLSPIQITRVPSPIDSYPSPPPSVDSPPSQTISLGPYNAEDNTLDTRLYPTMIAVS